LTARESLIGRLKAYATNFSEELVFVPRFLQLLQNKDCFQRQHLPGHITGSAWIVNHEATKVLMVQHASLQRWLQPGGHADGDEDILRTAIREAAEETGVTDLRLVGSSWFDLDIHPIPGKKNFPPHEHFDIRFLFVADEQSPLKISDESTDLRWIALDLLERFNNERSVLRMREKTILNLRAAAQTPR
jgi:8-oxo-dGTP pyrophosphatase MutT (NUDIX family)